MRGAGAALGPPSPHPHTQDIQLKETQSLFHAPAKRMKAQLHRVVVLSVYISAIITGILPRFTTVAVGPGCTQGHHFARPLKNTDSLKSLYPKGFFFSL